MMNVADRTARPAVTAGWVPTTRSSIQCIYRIARQAANGRPSRGDKEALRHRSLATPLGKPRAYLATFTLRSGERADFVRSTRNDWSDHYDPVHTCDCRILPRRRADPKLGIHFRFVSAVSQRCAQDDQRGESCGARGTEEKTRRLHTTSQRAKIAPSQKAAIY